MSIVQWFRWKLRSASNEVPTAPPCHYTTFMCIPQLGGTYYFHDIAFQAYCHGMQIVIKGVQTKFGPSIRYDLIQLLQLER